MDHAHHHHPSRVALQTVKIVSTRREYRFFLIFGGFFLLWNIISWRFPFFWDTILNSKIAEHYLYNGFGRLIPPESLDAGHPPFFSVYLAMLWKLFGRSLAVSHLAMLPFILGIVIQYANLARRFLPPRALIFAMLLLVLEPTLLAQSSMISGDLILLFGILLAINASLEGKTWKLGLALLLMAAVSLRGVMGLGVIFVCDFGYHFLFKERKLPWKHLIAYFAVGFLILGWFGWHWKVQGWAVSPPPETYGTHREILGLKGMLRNIAVTGWRFLDFGKVGLWLLMGIMVGIGLIRKWRPKPTLKPLIFLFLASTTSYLLLFMPFSNPIGHRYFLFSFLLFSLLVAYALHKIKLKPLKWGGFSVLAILLLTGHLWIYPQPISQGWDSSLAHLAYFPLRHQMDEYVLNHPDLDPEKIVTDFPMVNGSGPTRLTDETWSYEPLNDSTGIDDFPYVLESNVNNGFSGMDQMKLEKRYELVRGYELMGVYLRLYEKR